MDVGTALIIVGMMPIVTTALKEWRDERRARKTQEKIDHNTKLTLETKETAVKLTKEMNGMTEALVEAKGKEMHAVGKNEGIVLGEARAAARAEEKK